MADEPGPFEPDPLEPDPLDERVHLVELLDRVLDKGVMLRGDVTIGVAGIDLVYLELHLLLASVESLRRRGRTDV